VGNSWPKRIDLVANGATETAALIGFSRFHTFSMVVDGG